LLYLVFQIGHPGLAQHLRFVPGDRGRGQVVGASDAPDGQAILDGSFSVQVNDKEPKSSAR
ncbi:MAG: hypothetical protein KBO60_27795, partial [Achromobacter sp.]|nr:hypothetical protein [Achromobacter sp.]